MLFVRSSTKPHIVLYVIFVVLLHIPISIFGLHRHQDYTPTDSLPYPYTMPTYSQILKEFEVSQELEKVDQLSALQELLYQQIFDNEGKIEALLPVLDREISKLPDEEISLLKAKQTLLRARLTFQKGLYDDAIDLYDQSITFYQSYDASLDLWRCYQIRSSSFGFLGKSQMAIEDLLSSIETAAKIDSTGMMLLSYTLLTQEYLEIGDFFQAIRYGQIGIDISQKEDYPNYEIFILNNVASAYIRLEDYERAEDYLKRGLVLAKPMNDKHLEYMIYEKLIEVNIATERYSEARAYSFKVLNSLPYNYEQGILRLMLGKAYLYENNLDSALIYLNSSLKLHTEDRDTLRMNYTLNGLARAHLRNENLDKALVIAKNVEESLTKYSDQQFLLEDNFEVLYKIYESLDQYEEAFEYKTKYHKLISEKVRARTLQKASLYQQEAQFEKQRAAQQAKLTKERNRKNLSYLLLIFLLIISFVSWRSFQLVKRRNQRIEEQRKELKVLNQTKDKLFAILSHDLRSPLGGLITSLDMLSTGDLNNEDFRELSIYLKQNTKEVQEMLDNILVWSKSQIEQGFDANESVFDIKQKVDEVTRFLNHLSEQKQLKVKNLLADSLNVKADSDHITLVLRNLISNAIKYTPEHGSIAIDATTKQDEVIVSVSDTGQGIAPKQLEKLFTSDGSIVPTLGTNREKGIGLGLQLCKEMIEQNQGKIWVESELGKGTSFFFSIKAYKSHFPTTS